MTSEDRALADVVLEFSEIAREAIGDLATELGLAPYQVLSLALLLYQDLLDREDGGQSVFLARQVKAFSSTLEAYVDDTDPFGGSETFRALVRAVTTDRAAMQ